MIQTKPSSQLAAEKLAVNSLAQELSIPVNAISVVSAEAVEWPNPGLGCPDPDKFYPQVIVPGYKVTLDANGTHYPVHVGSDRAIVCHQ
ncbi:hypothetical protein TDB9533_01610 [Thalassocella blandensis]|nr:hypothetical protein TDB9533_01610 [Thalassocella blandensis]